MDDFNEFIINEYFDDAPEYEYNDDLLQDSHEQHIIDDEDDNEQF